jgi:cell wall-associated NlpC family hydrolase
LAGFDCSGFVSYVFKQLFPNQASSFSMNAAGYVGSSAFDDVDQADIQPGDIIFFPAVNGLPNHIGIVYDKDTWIGSETSTGVAKVKFSNPSGASES